MSDAQADLHVVTACRSCASGPLVQVLALGRTPLANALLPPGDGPLSADAVVTYPLDLIRCTACGLTQLAQIVSPTRLFSDYVYFSSTSETMLRHAQALADRLVEQEHLDEHRLVVEIASNDGYLLQYFKRRGVGVLGIEPAANIARVAEAEKGIPTLPVFFGRAVAGDLANQHGGADIVIGINVLAHVPDLNGFVAGVAALLKPSGMGVFEVPYLGDMLDRVEFDTIYHEHQCYFSLFALHSLFTRHNLEVVDIERLAIHGGSLRVSVAPTGRRRPNPAVGALLAAEEAWVLDDSAYAHFSQSVGVVKNRLLKLLDRLKSTDASIVAYGAAAKGVTLTSYCGIGRQYLEYVVDRSVHKQGQRFPVGGLHIYPPSKLLEDRPEYALLLTWNFAAEIVHQQAAYLATGGKFIVPVPEPRMFVDDV
jgi:SAM-dependent methyltransferase